MIDHATDCDLYPCTCAPDSYWVRNPRYGQGPSEPRLIQRRAFHEEDAPTKTDRWHAGARGLAISAGAGAALGLAAGLASHLIR